MGSLISHINRRATYANWRVCLNYLHMVLNQKGSRAKSWPLCGPLSLKLAVPDPLSLITCLSSRLISPGREGRSRVCFLTNKHIPKGSAVTHRNCNSFTEQDTPKNFSGEHQLFQGAALGHVIFRKTFCLGDEVAPVWEKPWCSDGWEGAPGSFSDAQGPAGPRGWSCRSCLPPRWLCLV